MHKSEKPYVLKSYFEYLNFFQNNKLCSSTHSPSKLDVTLPKALLLSSFIFFVSAAPFTLKRPKRTGRRIQQDYSIQVIDSF